MLEPSARGCTYVASRRLAAPLSQCIVTGHNSSTLHPEGGDMNRYFGPDDPDDFPEDN